MATENCKKRTAHGQAYGGCSGRQSLAESGTEFRLMCNSSSGSSEQDLQDMSSQGCGLGRAGLWEAPPPHGDMVQVVLKITGSK